MPTKSLSKTFLLIFFCAFSMLFLTANVFANAPAVSKPLSIVIIGGGPGGLSTAIEAHYAGTHVTIIEKRTDYTRHQRVFLMPPSLALLSKWGVVVPQMDLTDFGEYGIIGFVQIKHLEQALEKTVKQLGIETIAGEFIDINKQNAIITTSQGIQLYPYDILVGADGFYSRVRTILEIPVSTLGSAIGGWIYAPFIDTNDTIELSGFERQTDHYIRKITINSCSAIFWQSYFNDAFSLTGITKENLIQEIRTLGWEREAAIIENGNATVSGLVEISLQQAHTFSNISKSAILVGDAAATGSFFHGNGVNTAIKAAEVAGNFFSSFKLEPEASFCTFNRDMKKITDDLLNYSRPLLNPDTVNDEVK